MSYIEHEFEVVNKTAIPNTTYSLKRDLSNLGIQKGMIVLMHSSLSQLGWTVGGLLL